MLQVLFPMQFLEDWLTVTDWLWRLTDWLTMYRFKETAWADTTPSTSANPLETAAEPQWHNFRDCCFGKDQGHPSDPVSSLEVVGTAAPRQGAPWERQGVILSSRLCLVWSDDPDR